MDKFHPEGFLWPEERKLLHHFILLFNAAFAWNDTEHGHLREDMFLLVVIPTVPHTPWVVKNHRIPPGIFTKIVEALHQKIDTGIIEPSSSSYRSGWQWDRKKNGDIRLLWALMSLNKHTIRHAGVPPFTDQIAERFSCRACFAMMDLFIGFDERALAIESRNLTTFQTPLGTFCLTTLPMGWTNSVPIFHNDITFILRPEIPEVTYPYINDVPVRGPASRYILPNGEFETHPENSGIRRFVWEHFIALARVVQRMKHAGGTFSGFKSILCSPKVTVLGHCCTIEGRLPCVKRVSVIANWGPCSNITDVRSFLGTIGVCHIFIRNFAHRAHPISKLLQHNQPFEWGPLQVAAQEELKTALLNSPALRPIDYQSTSPVILSIDTSHIAIGFILSQCDVDNPIIRYFSCFSSITLNEREARFSQPKLELYGLYRALRALKNEVIGIRNFVVEVDAKYIKGMLESPNIDPSASINR